MVHVITGMESINTKYTLANGVEIPAIGFGTWQTPDGETAVSAVKAALEYGYRHIDTAAVYQNEQSVGKAIAESGVARKDIFVTSKLWNSERGYDKTIWAFEKSLADLGLEYLDLYLIHWPANEKQFANWHRLNEQTWRAFEELYKQKRIRAIGVSNFLPHHLEVLIPEAEVMPMVNQIEFHPGQMQEETVSLCRDNNILIEAWGPLGTGRMLDNADLKEIAAKYDVSVAQLCVRWCLQNGTLPLPKSVTPERIKQNLEVDFAISEEDMQRINAFPYIGGSGLNPDEVDF